MGRPLQHMIDLKTCKYILGQDNSENSDFYFRKQDLINPQGIPVEIKKIVLAP
jgi:hypothetical protein